MRRIAVAVAAGALLAAAAGWSADAQPVRSWADYFPARVGFRCQLGLLPSSVPGSQDHAWPPPMTGSQLTQGGTVTLTERSHRADGLHLTAQVSAPHVHFPPCITWSPRTAA